MEEINLNPHLIRWLKDYLSDRHQIVAVEGELSGKLPVVLGVLQGSILGPLLFIMYINTVTVTISSGSEINMFVDDIVLSYHQLTMQEDVNAISSINLLTLMKTNVAQCSSLEKGPTPYLLRLYILMLQN